MKVLEIYSDELGNEPFVVWLESIKDAKTRYRIVVRLDRVELGNLGDHKNLGGGLMELRLMFGPGYRIYCAEVGSTILLLVSGGDKSKQRRDIGRAREYLEDYLRRKQ